MSVIEFSRKDQTEPHVNGMAVCLDCRHEWSAAIAQSAYEEVQGWLLCPSCSLERGRMKFAHSPTPGTQIWHCTCGNNLMYMTPDGTFCPNCGTKQIF